MISSRRAAKSRTGSLTKIQLEVLKLRIAGLTQEEVAGRLGTTRQNVSLVERRARRNVEKAEETIAAYKRLNIAASITLKPTTHLVDVPRMLVDAADAAGVRISGDFSQVYRDLRRCAGDRIKGPRVAEAVEVHILRDGEIFVEPG